jgi:Flp pilus assembly protein TadG
MPDREIRRPLREDEGGAVAIIVTVVLVLVLIPMIAFAVDGGRSYLERSNAQNAADHAALAAAWAECNDRDPVAAGETSASRNGYAAAQVTITDIAEGWAAVVESEVATTFARTMQFDSVTVRARAVAACSPGEPGVTAGHNYAIFAGGNCSKNIDGSGSDNTIVGDVHSNRDIDFGGSGNHIYGQATYRTTANGPPKITYHPSENNPRNVATTDPTETNPRPYPVSYAIADYRPSGKYGSGSGLNYFSSTSDINLKDHLLTGNTIKPGIYYTTKKILVSDQYLNGDVTLVAEEFIDFSGSNLDVRPYHDGLLAFSNNNVGCGNVGVKMAGSNSKWKGTVFAPNSMIEYSGSTNNTLEGTLIGLHVRLNGQHLTINYQGGATVTDPSDPEVDLLR